MKVGDILYSAKGEDIREHEILTIGRVYFTVLGYSGRFRIDSRKLEGNCEIQLHSTPEEAKDTVLKAKLERKLLNNIVWNKVRKLTLSQLSRIHEILDENKSLIP